MRTQAFHSGLRHSGGVADIPARLLRHYFLLLLLCEILSWCAVVALAVLSVLWLRNPVPKIVLGVWAIASVESVRRAWPRGEKRDGTPMGAMVLIGPFYPLYWLILLKFRQARVR